MSGFLKISGDYSNWNVYRKAVVICDVTEMFRNRACLITRELSTRCVRLPARVNRILSRVSVTEPFQPICV